MNITPDPVAFSIGKISVTWYGILIASAFLIGTILFLKEAKRQKLNQEHLLDAILVAVPVALLGARLYYVIFNWDYYYRYPSEILAVWHGGLAIHGGLIGGILAGYFVVRKYKINFWQAIDMAAPSIVLGQAIGRWGNYFNQEAYGYEVDPSKIPWAMYIDGAYRHPTFLYESLWDFGVFLFLLWLRRRKGLQWGDVFFSYAVLYSVGRFFIEGLRTDSLMLTPYLRIAQVISAIIIIVALSLIFYRHFKKKTLHEKH